MPPPPPSKDLLATALPRVLLIDDDRDFCALITDYLAAFGYHVSAAHTGPAGAEKAAAEPWQAIILDVMLPGFDGFEVLRRIRRAGDTPVLMLTARGDEADQIVGLEIGAAVAELRINPGSRRATLGGKPLALTPGEFEILTSLARAKGRVKTRDHLLAEIRDREYEVFDRAIDVQISALRRKLGDDPKNPRFIRTVRSAGYMLVDPGEEG